jgi:hypothetical protein
MSSKDDFDELFKVDCLELFEDNNRYKTFIQPERNTPFLKYDKLFQYDYDKPFLDKLFQYDYDKPSQDDYSFSFSKNEPINANNSNDQDNFSFVSSFFHEHHTFNRNSQNNANDLNNQDNLSYHNISNSEKKKFNIIKLWQLINLKVVSLLKMIIHIQPKTKN